MATPKNFEDTERDKRFIEFGRAVVKHMLGLRGGWIDFNEDNQEAAEEYSSIIAHHAYSLAYFILECAEIDLHSAVPSEIIKNLPVMVLPEDQEEIWASEKSNHQSL